MSSLVVRRKRVLDDRPIQPIQRPARVRGVGVPSGLEQAAVQIGLVALYLVLTVYETAPLLDHLGDAIVGYLDAPVLGLWDAWWTRHALLDLHQNPYFTDYVLQPFGANLALHTYSLVTGLLTIPFTPVFGPVVAFNLVVIAGFVGTALGGAWLARSEFAMHWWPAAFVGSAITFTANLTANFTHGHYNLITTWALPWAFLLVLRALRTGSVRSAAVAGLLVGLQGLQDLYLLATLGLALVIYVAGTGFWRAKQSWRRRAYQLLSFVGAALVVFAPEATALWAERSEFAGLGQDLGSASAFSPDLLSYVVPSYLSPYFGSLTSTLADHYHFLDVPKETYLGWTVLILAGLAAWRRPAPARVLRPLWILAGVFFLLSLGPYLHLLGTTTPAGVGPIPLPYAWFHVLPFINLARTPGNNVVMVSFALAIVGGLVLDRLQSRSPKLGRACVVAAIVFAAVEAKAVLPMTGAVDRPTFDWLANQGTATMLEVPAGVRDGRQGFGDAQSFVQLDQTYHHQRIFGGFIARIPDAVFASYENDPVLAYFADPQHARQPPGPAALARLRSLQVRYVLVYGSPYAGSVRDFLAGQLHLNLVRQESGLWLYEVSS